MKPAAQDWQEIWGGLMTGMCLVSLVMGLYLLRQAGQQARDIEGVRHNTQRRLAELEEHDRKQLERASR